LKKHTTTFKIEGYEIQKELIGNNLFLILWFKKYDEVLLEEVITLHPEIIYFIKKPTRKLIKIWIKTDPSVYDIQKLKYIDNEKIQFDIVDFFGYSSLRYIKKHNEKVLCHLLQENPRIISSIGTKKLSLDTQIMFLNCIKTLDQSWRNHCIVFFLKIRNADPSILWAMLDLTDNNLLKRRIRKHSKYKELAQIILDKIS
jgi:hypothetical protein